MSGVLNEFEARIIRYSVAEHTVYLNGPLIKDSVFKYNIMCERKEEGFSALYFFFNTENWQCMVVATKMGSERYRCFLTRFWLDEDIPVLSVNIFENQNKVMAKIHDTFKEQYAALILDGIINS